MYNFILATPEKVIFEGAVSSLVAPGAEGYFGVLTNHAPFISALQAGKIEVVDKDGKKLLWDISGGIFEMFQNQAVLLADGYTHGE